MNLLAFILGDKSRKFKKVLSMVVQRIEHK